MAMLYSRNSVDHLFG